MKKKFKYVKICPDCKKEFKTELFMKTYCCKKCSQRYHQRKYQRKIKNIKEEDWRRK